MKRIFVCDFQTMDLGHVLQQYDSEVRARPKARSGFEVERTGGVIRLTGHFNFICSWDLAPGAAREAVASQAAYFRSRGEKLIWRVYEHDKPADLGDCLAEEGFEADQPGTLMIFDLANQIPALVPSAHLELGSSNFGLLFGGGVSPAYRRRGLYRALVAARAKEAKRWGCSYLVTDARETSRPILQDLSFIGAASETTWVLPPQ